MALDPDLEAVRAVAETSPLPPDWPVVVGTPPRDRFHLIGGTSWFHCLPMLGKSAELVDAPGARHLRAPGPSSQ